MNDGDTPWQLMGCRGCGSAIVEAALVLAKIPYEASYEGDATTVVLPDGTEMTESAAIILYVDGLVPELGLVPGVRDPLRRELLRWLMFLVAAVNPTFHPDSTTTDDHRQSLWRLVEGAVRGPWFLGETPSALDLYVSVMTRREPGRAWFGEHCPRLYKIATAVDEDERLKAVWATNFS